MPGKTYTVVVCTECDYVWIVQDEPDTTSCKQCDTQHKFRKLKHLYTGDDYEKAKEARTLKQAEIQGIDHIYKQLLEDGDFDSDVKDAVVDEKYLQKQNVDPTEVYGEDNNEKPQSKREIIEVAIDELDTPTDENVIEFAEEYGLEEEEVTEFIDLLCRHGEAMRKRDGTIRLL